MRQGLSDLGRARPETLGAPTLSDEAATDRKKSAEAVAQAAQVEGLPDLDHARHFSEVSEEVSAAVIEEALISGFYDLVRPLL